MFLTPHPQRGHNTGLSTATARPASRHWWNYQENRKGSAQVCVCVRWNTAHRAFLYLSEDTTPHLAHISSLHLLSGPPGPWGPARLQQRQPSQHKPLPPASHTSPLCLPLFHSRSPTIAYPLIPRETHEYGGGWPSSTWYTQTRSLPNSPFTHLFMYGYLDWRLQALPSSALTPHLSEALWVTACVNVAAKLCKAALSTSAAYTFKWKERQYRDAVDWYVYKSASVAVQMSIECMCYVNTQRTFFLSAAKPACNSRRLQTALFFTDKHASLCSCWQWLTSFWNQLFCPLCRKHVHAYSTKHAHTHRRINTYRSAHILFFHTNTHACTVTVTYTACTQEFPHSTVCTLHTEKWVCGQALAGQC